MRFIVGSANNLHKAFERLTKPSCGAGLRSKGVSSATAFQCVHLYCLLAPFFGAVFARFFDRRSRPPISVRASSALSGSCRTDD
jgi:hypothetical protein